MSTKIPNIFCLSKIGAEAGQSIDVIVGRKELERRANNGVFAWGIGNSLGNKVALAKIGMNKVEVLFCPMKAKPKAVDVAPGSVLLWLDYLNEEGEKVPLPSGSIVTSRGGAGDDPTSKTHYALLCRTSRNLTMQSPATVNLNNVKNYRSTSPLGASQVTAMVQHTFRQDEEPKPYRIQFRADFAGPGFVKLATPYLLDAIGQSLLNDLSAASNDHDWIALVNVLKRRAREALNDKQIDLFGY